MGFKTTFSILAALVLQTATGAPTPQGSLTPRHCTRSITVSTGGFLVNYALVTPTVTVAGHGYEPEPVWAASHRLLENTLVGALADAELKCQDASNAAGGSSFFLQSDSANGYVCTVYDDLLDSDIFILSNQTDYSAYDFICN